MRQNFPLFQSHLDLAHRYWKSLLHCGDWVIDATCGRGNDTLELAHLLQEKGGGGVIGIDIQQEAILATRELLETRGLLSNVHLFHGSHTDFPKLAGEVPIKLVVYNLGYLPKGNKGLTTQVATTLQSVEKALELLVPGGGLSIACYPGHPEGALEEKALVGLLGSLPPALWNVYNHSSLNRNAAPSLILVQKTSGK